MRTLKQNRMRCFAVVLIAALLVGVIPQTYSYARSRIDIGRTCSLSLRASSEYADLNSASVTVRVYRVADVDENGVFELLDGFEAIGLPTASDKSDAIDWEQIANAAADAASMRTADQMFSVVNGVGGPDALDCGMYLLCADAVETSEYAYTFSPILVSLPDNALTTDGDDMWSYNVDIALKAQRTPLTGSFSVTKTLKTCNQSLGMPMFVFDVEAVKDGEVVYSNVLSLSFTEAGTKSVTVDGIPAGSVVTVSEVYAGAAYELESQNSVQVTVTAGNTEDAAFVNDYDDTLTYGTGVVNHFAYDGSGYTWEQLESNAQ